MFLDCFIPDRIDLIYVYYVTNKNATIGLILASTLSAAVVNFIRLEWLNRMPRHI